MPQPLPTIHELLTSCLTHSLVKILKGPIYEGRLADCATVFKDRQKDIRMTLMIHAAVNLDSAMDTLTDINQNVRSTDEKIAMILLFRRFDSSKEKELIKFVQAKGGAQKCLENDNILLELTQFRQELDQTLRQTDSERDAHVGRTYGSSRAGQTGYPSGTPRRYAPSWHSTEGPFPAKQNRLLPHRPSASPNVHRRSYYPSSAPFTPAYPSIPETSAIHTSPFPPRPYPDYSSHTSSPLAENRYSRYYSTNQLNHQTGQEPFARTAAYATPAATYGGSIADQSSEVAVLQPLKTELDEDLEISLEKNMVLFERKLDVQKRQITAALSDIVQREGNRVVAAVTSGLPNLVIDSVCANIRPG